MFYGSDEGVTAGCCPAGDHINESEGMPEGLPDPPSTGTYVRP